MSDVAQLGLAVDSGQVTSATTALKTFSGAANDAATSADKLNLGNGKLGPSMSAVESMAKRAGVSVDEMSARIKAASTSYDQAASSQNKYVAITQQAQAVNAKSAQAANDNSAAIAGIGTASEGSRTAMDRFTASLTRAFIAGGAAIAIRAISQYVWNLNAALAATAIAAEQASVSYQKFQGLQNAASNRGVTNDEFNTAMVSFNKQVELAKAGLGDLRGTLAINGKAVSDTATTFATIADLVKNARTETERENVLQAAGLPTTAQFVRYMQQGSQAIREAADESKKLTDDQLDGAKRVNDQWNEVWTNFEQSGKAATLKVFDGMKSALNGFATLMTNGLEAVGVNVGKNLLKDAMNPGGTTPGSQLNANSGVSGFYSSLGTGAPGNGGQAASADKTKTIQQTRELIGLEQQRIGILGQTATVDQQVRAVELQVQQARANNVNVTSAEEANLVRLARAQALGAFQINAQTDAEKVRLATLGMSSEAGIAYEIVQTKINEALARGTPLTQDQITQLQAAADNYARVKVQADLVRQAIDISSTAASSVFKNIAEGVAPMKAFADAAKSAAESIIDIATKKIAENLLGGLFSDTASQTTGATSAATILTTAGTTVAASIVAGATEAATILGLTIPPAAATLPVAGAATGVEVAAGGAAAGASMAAGGAAAGAAIWGPIAILLAAIAAVASFSFFGGGKKDDTAQKQAAQELKQAQDAWHAMTEQLIAFNQAAAGTTLGPLTNEIIQLQKSLSDLSLAAEKAQDFAAVPGLQNTFNEGVSRVVKEFVDGAPVLTDLQQKMADVSNEGQGLISTLAGMGLATAEGVQQIQAAVVRQQAALRQAFIDDQTNSLIADVRNNSGVGYLNTISDAIQKFNDLASQGVNPSVLQAWLVSTAQTAVNSAQLTGQAFQDLIAQFPQLTNVVHEFIDTTAQAAKAAQDATEALSLQLRLLTATTDSSSLGGALALFDAKAKQEYDAAVASGSGNLTLLLQVQSAERQQIIDNFAKQAADAEKQLADQRLAQIQRIQQYLDGLTGGSNSSLSPQDRLKAAQSQFTQQIGLAQGGDQNAISNITSYSDQLLQAAKSYYSSSTGYQDIFASVQAALQSLIGTGLSSSVTSSGLPTSSTINGVSSISTPIAANSNSWAGVVDAVNSLKGEVVVLKTTLKASIDAGNASNAQGQVDENGKLDKIVVNTGKLASSSNLALAGPL